jgi:glycosyltransferase involved in cell wall biosynthesis
MIKKFISQFWSAVFSYQIFRRGQYITLINLNMPNWFYIINPWACYAKAVAHSALGDLIAAKKYSHLLITLYPFHFIKNKLAKHFGRLQPQFVRELLSDRNELRIAFELINGASPLGFSLNNFKLSSFEVNVLYKNRSALKPIDRVVSINNLLQSYQCNQLEFDKSLYFKIKYSRNIIKRVEANDHIKVSILVTAYNCGDYVKQSIESLLAQTHHNLQILIANDASLDNTWRELKALSRKDPRLTLFNLSENIGTYAAKSLLLKFASGEYVICHDADDLVDPMFIQKSLSALMQNKNKVGVISNWFRLDEDLKIFPGAVRRFWPLLSINHSSLMLSTSLLKKLGGWDVPRVAADTELFERIRAIYGNKSVLQLRIPLTIGSMRVNSLMNDKHFGSMLVPSFRRRVEYREAWVAWHIRCKKQGIKPVMVSPFEKMRPFKIPSQFRVKPSAILRCYEAMKASVNLPIKEGDYA